MNEEKFIKKQKNIKRTKDKIFEIESKIQDKYDSLDDLEDFFWYLKNFYKIYSIYLYEARLESYNVKKKFQDASYNYSLSKYRKKQEK